MSIETWVAIVSAGAALLAAGGALWQAAQARQSAQSASKDQQKAEEAAVRAAAAGERTALALEEANALARARGVKPRWAVSVTRGRTNDEIRVTNQGADAYDVTAKLVNVEGGSAHSDTFPAEVLGSGLSGTLRLLRHWGTPDDIVLEVAWSDTPDGERQSAKITI